MDTDNNQSTGSKCGCGGGSDSNFTSDFVVRIENHSDPTLLEGINCTPIKNNHVSFAFGHYSDEYGEERSEVSILASDVGINPDSCPPNTGCVLPSIVAVYMWGGIFDWAGDTDPMLAKVR